MGDSCGCISVCKGDSFIHAGEAYLCWGQHSGALQETDAPEEHETMLLTAQFSIREKADDIIAPVRTRSSVS